MTHQNLLAPHKLLCIDIICAVTDVFKPNSLQCLLNICIVSAAYSEGCCNSNHSISYCNYKINFVLSF